MYPLDTMGHKRSAWWRNPPNGTLGDTEDENLVEATVHKDVWNSLLKIRVTRAVFFERSSHARALASRPRDRAARDRARRDRTI